MRITLEELTDFINGSVAGKVGKYTVDAATTTTTSLTSLTSPFLPGSAYFIRTVTYHLTGRVREVQRVGEAYFLVLDEAAWIADSGRFMQALKDGVLKEVEPVPDGTLVNVAAITDAFQWNHPLPKEQK